MVNVLLAWNFGFLFCRNYWDEQHFSDSLTEMVKTRYSRVLIVALAITVQLGLVCSQSQVGKKPLPYLFSSVCMQPRLSEFLDCQILIYVIRFYQH